MSKFKGLLLSVSMAAVLMSGVVYAEETEVTEVVTEAAEEMIAEEVMECGLIASDVSMLENYAAQNIQMVVEMTDEEADSIVNPISILSQYQDSVVESVKSWQEAKGTLGDFVGITGHDIELNKGQVVIKTTCDFSKSQSVVTTTLDKDLSMESMTFSTGKQSLATKMKEAVLNTIMGVSVVFLMLLFLTYLIGQFARISEIEAALKKRNAPEQAPAPAAAAPVQETVEEEYVDDGELIAVIAAAIAAAEGTTTDGFVVRSIKKSNRNKWQRA